MSASARSSRATSTRRSRGAAPSPRASRVEITAARGAAAAGTDMRRRGILKGMGGLLVGQAIGASAAAAALLSVPPGEAGFTDQLWPLLDKAIAGKRVWNVHGLVVLRGGRLVLERYFAGEDSARGRKLGEVAFAADTLHDMRSVSKSIVGLLYGIALAEGKVPPPEAPLLAAFPEYPDLAADPARAR